MNFLCENFIASGRKRKELVPRLRTVRAAPMVTATAHWLIEVSTIARGNDGEAAKPNKTKTLQWTHNGHRFPDACGPCSSRVRRNHVFALRK